MSKVILVVEDEKKVQRIIKDILESANYEVIIADNADDAYVRISGRVPDLIISDVMMPGPSGFEFLEELKKNPNYFTIPFIFLTARADIDDIRTGMNIGSDDYLVKPFRAKDLLHSVKIRLERKKFYDEKIFQVSKNLSSHVPHELRTPLVAILGYPDLMTEYYDELSKDEKLEMLKSIKFSGRRLQNTIEKLITLSEVQRKTVLEEKQSESNFVKSIEGIVLEVGGILSNNFERTNSFEAEIEDLELGISDSLFREVIKQLIENAYLYSDNEQKVRVVGRKIDSEYLVEVIDNGVGLNEDELKKLDTFIQYERDRRVLSGLGLGLRIVKSILEFYNIKLQIKSKKNEGSIFYFRIPSRYIN